MPGPLFIDPCPPEHLEMHCRSLAFLLRHSATSTYFLFDMGVRKDLENFAPAVARILLSVPTKVPQDVKEGLEKRGLKPDDIEYICLSHIHWDHIGDTRLFGTSKFLVGKDAKPLMETGYPKSPDSEFQHGTVPLDRTTFLDPDDGQWKPIGPFPRALDFFGDGSLYIVDAPGHLPGHVNILVRTSADGGWVYLAGDVAHHWRVITGESKIAVARAPTGEKTFCAHANTEMAYEMIRRIRALKKMGRVRVILAHESDLWKDGREGPWFFPGRIDSL